MAEKPATNMIAALCQAKLSFQPVKKNKTAEAGKFSYSYADLAAVIDATAKPLAENGLAIGHSTQFTDGFFILTSTLFHVDGESVSSSWPLPDPFKTGPQQLGSALSYGRRYNTLSLLDIAAEDDLDAQDVKDTKASTRQGRASPPMSDPAPAAEPQSRGAAPYFIPVPVPGKLGVHDMTGAWKRWIAEYTAALDDAEDTETINAIEKANKAPLDGLQAASEKGYGHVVGYAHERRKRAAENPLGAG